MRDIQMIAPCTMTEFKEGDFINHDVEDGHISISPEMRTFSLRQGEIMLTVSLDNAVTTIAHALEGMRAEEETGQKTDQVENQETEEPFDQKEDYTTKIKVTKKES